MNLSKKSATQPQHTDGGGTLLTQQHHTLLDGQKCKENKERGFLTLKLPVFFDAKHTHCVRQSISLFAVSPVFCIPNTFPLFT